MAIPSGETISDELIELKVALEINQIVIKLGKMAIKYLH